MKILRKVINDQRGAVVRRQSGWRALDARAERKDVAPTPGHDLTQRADNYLIFVSGCYAHSL